jgi:hypothetical protein
MSRSISVREAWALFGLFMGQFTLGGVLPPDVRDVERIVIAIIYLVLTAAMIYRQRDSVRPLMRDAFRTPVRDLAHDPSSGSGELKS